ncbi:MAG TPA: TIGR03013 family XrtA/PEP-CTERM system glycosyltransferase [Polyangiaceae bacterium]|nr:TIGR03013 family XrtA/PEP-CTERM system glycosyltransferase [Polyangiaceae bacterium]
MVELFRSPRKLLLFFYEGTLVVVTVLVSACLRLGVHAGLTMPHVAKKALLFAAIMQAAFYYAGLYDLATTRHARVVYERALRGVALGAIVLLLVFYTLPALEIGRGIFLVALALSMLAVPAWRILYNGVSEGSGFLRRTLIVGNGELARELARMVRARPDFGLDLVGMLARDRLQIDAATGVIGTYRDLYSLVTSERIEVVLVAYPDRRGTLPVEQLLEVKFRGVEVEEGVAFYERETGKIFVRELKPSQLIFAEGFRVRPATRRLKRLLDLVVAIVGLGLAAPLMILSAIAIAIDSPGPLLYRQVRSGELGRTFTLYKFRSMRVDAEKSGARFAEENDPRITRVGRLIRKMRIDELPQLYNVLRGEMSMVGPRPERPVFIEQLEQQVPYFKQRLYVKPGLTGHAQVRCRYGATAEDHLEKLQYDLYYIKSYSVMFDLSIIFDTIKVVLLRIGAR